MGDKKPARSANKMNKLAYNCTLENEAFEAAQQKPTTSSVKNENVFVIKKAGVESLAAAKQRLSDSTSEETTKRSDCWREDGLTERYISVTWPPVADVRIQVWPGRTSSTQRSANESCVSTTTMNEPGQDHPHLLAGPIADSIDSYAMLYPAILRNDNGHTDIFCGCTDDQRA
ncbi:hypothetical protein Y032_0010g992 [Ancylostoma ceylanicum]|uniref:Uncharacterized protein n=1 Tax=Ancylostoma ceylanicum TaxID=53326 RepID=A0A016VIH4_9BILA|nr:hypothetical protein Y032_0010g992 [Ancylostoma ceylanicum]